MATLDRRIAALETTAQNLPAHVILVRFEGTGTPEVQRIVHRPGGPAAEEWLRRTDETPQELAQRAVSAVSGRGGIVVLIEE